VLTIGTTAGGTAGRFRWGPIEEATLVQSESDLVSKFGAPNATNVVDFLTAANYISYSPNLYVVRQEGANVLNATAEDTTGGNGAGTGLLIKNDDVWEASYSTGSGNVGPWAAKYAGALGNSIQVSTCASSAAWQSTLTGTWTVGAGSTIVVGAGGSANTEVTVGDLIIIGGRSIKVASVTNANYLTLESAHITGATGATATRRWEYFGQFDSEPGTSTYVSDRGGSGDEMHIVVVDKGGTITNVAGTVLEKFQQVSKAEGAKTDTGASNYYKDVITTRSEFIRWMDHESGTNWGGNTATSYTGSTNSPVVPVGYRLAGGSDGSTPTDTQKIAAFNVFANKANISINLMPMGAVSATVINTVIADIAEQRKDVMVCVSPEQSDVVNQAGSEVTNILDFAATVSKSTYVVFDSNWKFQYDKYNDTYVYVPCNADTAGVMARTDFNLAPWNSPAGYTKGTFLNVTKLAWNPNEAERDLLYKQSVNPIFTQTGRGTVLFGDKTFVLRGTSFNRINVRRLFIELQKTIGDFAGNVLFDENNQASRTAFINTIDPYLRDVQAQRGITDFRVVCDETNNTDSVVNANEFICDIFVRPTSSVNFIQLNFVSVRGSISFAELGA
jgi:phage tail sheath protein FI